MNPNRMLSIIMLLLVEKRKISISELSKIFGCKFSVKLLHEWQSLLKSGGFSVIL